MSQKDIGLQVDDALLLRYGTNEAKLLHIRGQANTRGIRRKILRNLTIIDNIAVRVSDWSRNQQSIPQEFEWLLDNRYLLEREGKQAALSLRGAGRLPLDRTSGFPAVYTAMQSLTRATRGEVTLARLGLFLEGFQAEQGLTERELSLLMPMLKAALVSVAAAVCLDMRGVLTGFSLDPQRNPYAAERTVLHALSQGSAPPANTEELAGIAKTQHALLSLQLGNVISALRLLASADIDPLLQKASVVEQILREDPSGHYALMSEETRMSYRQALSKLAKRAKLSEESVAGQVIALAAKEPEGVSHHVGYYIFQKPLGKESSQVPGKLYLSGILLCTLLGMGAVWLLTHQWWAALISLVPLLDIAKYLGDFVAVRVKSPTHIPRMDCKNGIPETGKTLCVITALLSKPTQVYDFSHKLEQYYLSNHDAGPHMLYGLLCDLPDSAHQTEADDEAIMQEASHAIAALNRRYGHGFYLFFRERQYNTSERRYLGWERKRGALTELMRCLRQLPNGLSINTGEPTGLNNVQFVVTLDSDTRLSAGTLRPLVGAMLHPLNTPVIDQKKRVVIQGHGLLQPRMAVELRAASVSFFTQLYAGQGGLDPYNGNVSEVYQDYFGRSAFVGKGVVHVNAFLLCLDNRLPECRVLSHDLLEGSYLRAGFVGDIEWSDGYPPRVSSWLERGHRWIRGDWQIAAWIGRKVPILDAGHERNPLAALPCIQIFDNLRRSITPFLILLFMSAALLRPENGGLLTLGLLSLLSLGIHLIISTGHLAARGGAGGGQRFHATIIIGLKASVYQFITGLWLLPMQAFSGVHAICAALWRTHISHRHMLSWRTAADADRHAGTAALEYLRHYWVSAVWGLLLLLFSPHISGRVFGALWLCSPLYGALISKAKKVSVNLSAADRQFLKQEAVSIWRYFEDFVTPADHDLPPDNWQEQPATGIAHRTSPTNIGLGLLSALAALDLEFIDDDKALRFIERMVSTMERLPKWHGHLYNWYDTSNLQPLRPMCVSTVDSGNLAGYLVTLREGLLELNDAAAEDLAARVHVLYEAMDFRPLYDGHRRLFYIGYDLELNRPTESYYDLLASEARQTSYLAIARGQVPRNHWRRLGRVLAARDRYSGMSSWTGTMFEYFMPHLLMPAPDNSLLAESLQFAVYCQRKRGLERKVPWGISESCFFAFDGALNYQYKAHGEPRLAYKRGLGQDLVVSPYSTFLALQVAPKAAIENLKRLRSMGLEGLYGLCEAADFTPTRLTGSQPFMPVKCYMSHHLGMSLLSIDNALNKNIMQRRFMRDPQMGAYHELLEEKVPVGGVMMRARGQEVPEKPPRNVVVGWTREYEGYDLAQPHCTLLSNSAYTLFCTDAGLTASHSAGLSLTRFAPDQSKWGLGWQFFIKQDEVWTGLTAAPMVSPRARYNTTFDVNSVRWDMRTSDESLHTSVTARVPLKEHGEVRGVTLRNAGKTPVTLELYAYLEPVLAQEASHESHPAFSKLFLQTQCLDQTVHIQRRPRDGQSTIHMVIACDASEVQSDTARELVLPRGGAASFTQVRPTAGSDGAVLDPCVLQRVAVTLQPGASRQINFAMAVAASHRDAEAAAIRTLKLGDDAEAAGVDGPMRLLGLTPAEAHGALDWLTDLLFITQNRTRQSFDAEHNTQGQSALWQWGISGDLPILVVMGADAQPERLSRLLRQYRFLSLVGMRCDFVVHTQDGSDYRRPQRGHIMETLKAIGCESVFGARGGVHIVDASATTGQDTHLLMSAAALVLDGQKPERRVVPVREAPMAVPPPALPVSTPRPVVTRWLADGSFQFDIQGTLPDVAWSHTLTNASFGGLMRDSGCGHIWRLNSRENKLTPWDNDPRALQSGEIFTLTLEGRQVSPFADLDGFPCEVTYGFGVAQYKKSVGDVRITTTAFVPPDRMARIITIEVEGVIEASLHHFA